MASEAFNPYHRWLGIAPEDQPPNHYRLLGIPLFESDPDVISSAADRQMAHVRSFQTGRHSVESQRVLNEISAARVCLLNAEKKHAYDAMLRHEMEAAATSAASRTVAKRKPHNQQMQMFVVAAGAVVGLIVVGLFLLPNAGREPADRLDTPEPEIGEAKPRVTPQKPQAPEQPDTKVETATAPPALAAEVPTANAELAAAEVVSRHGGFVNSDGKGVLRGTDNPSTESSVPSLEPPGEAQVADQPARPPLSEWIALAPLAQLDGDSPPATWKLAGDTAEFRAGRGPGSVSVPLPIDGSYDLQYRVEIAQYARNNSISLYLPVAQDRAAKLQMKGVYREEGRTILELLGLAPAPKAEGDAKVELAKEYAFTCSVTVAGKRVAIQVLRDGQTLFAWSGDLAQVSPGPRTFKVATPGTGYGMTAKFRDLRLRRTQRGLSPHAENAPASKVPDEASQAKARALVTELFGAELDEAEGSPEKSSALAKKLYQTASGSPDSASRYVLLDVARRVSVDAGNIEPALQAVDEMGRSFQIDTAEMKVEIVETIAAKAHLPAQYVAVLECIPSLIDKMVTQDNYDAALSVGKVALSIVRRTRDNALIKRAVADNKKLESLAKGYGRFITPQLAVLEGDPDDPAANKVVGEYYCYIKGDWTKGLPLLAKCDDPALKALAAKELTGNLDLKARVEVADEWWSRAEVTPTPPNTWWAETPQALKRHAVTLYEADLPGLTGLHKERVRQRIESAGESTDNE